jgi:TolB protein
MRICVRLLALLPVLLVLAGCGSSKKASPPDIVFVSTRDGDYALFGVSAGGGDERRLTKDKGDPSSPAGLFYQVDPAWSPDGKEIAFTSRRDGRSHVFAMRPDGTGVRHLTISPHDDDHPAWSPDGRRIAFGREGALFVIPSKGGIERRLGRGLGSADDPAWSPNGSFVAYDYRQPGYSIREIWIMGADGGHARQVTRLGAVSAHPTWSADGRRIAFHSNVRGNHYEIYSIGTDGKALHRETGSAIDTIEPAWSPDGKIAFSRDGAIWTVDPAGKTKRVTSSQNDSSPAWRPH